MYIIANMQYNACKTQRELKILAWGSIFLYRFRRNKFVLASSLVEDSLVESASMSCQLKDCKKTRSRSVSILVALLFLSLSLGLSLSNNTFAQSSKAQPRKIQIFVYVPSLANVFKLQQDLNKVCQDNFNFVLTEKFNEFSKLINNNQPEFIITYKSVIAGNKTFKNFTSLYKAAFKQKTTEDYLLASLKPLADHKLASMSLGAVNIMGRDEMAPYLSQLIGPFETLRFTSKISDLIALMRFGRAEMIFLSKRHMNTLQLRIHQKLFYKLIETQISLPQIAIRESIKPNSQLTHKLQHCLNKIPQRVHEAWGTDEWIFNTQ